MKTVNKIITFLLIICSLFLFSLSGCKKPDNGENNENNPVEIKPSGTPYVSDYSYLYGICETPYELLPEIDPAMNTDWIAHVDKTMGIKSQRVWYHINNLVEVHEDDSVTLNQEYADRITYVLNKIKEAGIEKISLFSQDRILLAEDRKKFSRFVPDPTSEYDKYMRSLKVEEKAFELIAAEFPQVDYFEMMNELDHYSVPPVCKDGYVLNWTEPDYEFMYTTEETIKIVLDYHWYIRRGLKKGNPNAKLMLGSLCHYNTTAQYLEDIYATIYSKKVPSGTEYSDTDPDNYFDALNWHPYVNDYFGVGSYVGQPWIDRQIEIHDVAVKYGDAEKPVWYTEFGFTDGGNASILGEVTATGQTGLSPTNFIDALEAIKEHLPFVETLCFFRITDMYNVKYDVEGENTFGLFYNPDDPINKGKPKPAAVALTRYIKGGKITLKDMQELCKGYYEAFGDIPEEYKCVITD